MEISTIVSIFLGISLAASVGFRIFVPFFVLSLAAHYQIVPLNENWEWVGTTAAILTLGIATIVEIAAYLIPWVDHLLDTIAIPLAAIAGTAIMLSTIANFDPLFTWVLAIIAGGGTATAIKSSTSTTRLASTTATAGLANPVVSVLESGTSVFLSIVAVFLPIAAILIVIAILWFVVKLFKKVIPKRKLKNQL
jgi:hypothetical protein